MVLLTLGAQKFNSPVTETLVYTLKDSLKEISDIRAKEEMVFKKDILWWLESLTIIYINVKKSKKILAP